MSNENMFQYGIICLVGKKILLIGLETNTKKGKKYGIE